MLLQTSKFLVIYRTWKLIPQNNVELELYFNLSQADQKIRFYPSKRQEQ